MLKILMVNSKRKEEKLKEGKEYIICKYVDGKGRTNRLKRQEKEIRRNKQRRRMID